MQLRDLFKPKYLVLSFGLGLALMLSLAALVSIRGEEAAIRIVMWPGVLLSSLSGYGGHDLPGILFYFLGNTLFYWLVAFLFLGWWRTRRQARHDATASGPTDKNTTP